MKVELKKLNENAVLPSRGSKEAAGYDLYALADQPIEIAPHTTVMVGTGLSLAIPDGYFGGVFARSGMASKRNLRPANCVGVIDSDYRGELMVPIHNDSEEKRVIEAKERIAQLIILPYLSVEFDEVEELDETARGESGFGSTGSK
jgi:dUTP pyrophosphatase